MHSSFGAGEEFFVSRFRKSEMKKLSNLAPNITLEAKGLCMMSPGVARDLTDAERDTMHNRLK